MNLYIIKLNNKLNETPANKQKKNLSDLVPRRILSNELHISPSKISISKNNFGKPFLDNQHRHFNISWSKNIFVMVTDSAPIGIDIEFIKPIDDIDNLMNYFTDEDKENYHQLGAPEKMEYFYQVWVLKESYVKAIGKGFSCPLNSFYIRTDREFPSLVYTAEKDLDWSFKIYSLLSEYKAAICAKNNQFPEKPIILQLNEILGT